MEVEARSSQDREQLGRLMGSEPDAMQRDRYRAAALALDGRLTEEIVEMLDRSRAFVKRWTYAYRDGGLGAIDDDQVCAFRGRDIQHILQREFGVKYSLNGVYELLHRMGYSWLAPRPRHRHADAQAQEAFKQSAPLL